MLSKVLRHLTLEQRDCEFDYILVTNYLTSGQLISHKSLLLHYTFYIKSEVFCAIYKKLLPVQLYQYHHFPRSSLYSSALLTLTILWCLQHFLFFYSQHHSASQCCYKISRFCPLQIHIFMCFWYEFTVISMAFLVLSYNIQKCVLKQSKSVLSSIKDVFPDNVLHFFNWNVWIISYTREGNMRSALHLPPYCSPETSSSGNLELSAAASPLQLQMFSSFPQLLAVEKRKERKIVAGYSIAWQPDGLWLSLLRHLENSESLL